MQERLQDRLSTAYGSIFQVDPLAVHGDRNFREYLRKRYDYYDKLLIRIRHKSEGMAAKGFSETAIKESEQTVKVMLNHWATILQTMGSD